jgi:hypothetical protein
LNVNPPTFVVCEKKGGLWRPASEGIGFPPYRASSGPDSKSAFCDRYHIVNATAKLGSTCRIGTAYAVLTFDVPPNSAPANAGLSLRPNRAPDVRIRFRCCESTTSKCGAACLDGSYFPSNRAARRTSRSSATPAAATSFVHEPIVRRPTLAGIVALAFGTGGSDRANAITFDPPVTVNGGALIDFGDVMVGTTATLPFNFTWSRSSTEDYILQARMAESGNLLLPFHFTRPSPSTDTCQPNPGTCSYTSFAMRYTIHPLQTTQHAAKARPI